MYPTHSLSDDDGGDETLDRRTFACGGAGLLGFVVFILLVAEQDSRYVEDKSDQIQVTGADVRSGVDSVGPVCVGMVYSFLYRPTNDRGGVC